METGAHFLIKSRNPFLAGFPLTFLAKADTYDIRGFVQGDIAEGFSGVIVGEKEDVRSFLLDIQFSPETRPWLIYSLETTPYPVHLFPSNVGMEVVE